jgi:hypothetical protein
LCTNSPKSASFCLSLAVFAFFTELGHEATLRVESEKHNGKEKDEAAAVIVLLFMLGLKKYPI